MKDRAAFGTLGLVLFGVGILGSGCAASPPPAEAADTDDSAIAAPAIPLVVCLESPPCAAAVAAAIGYAASVLADILAEDRRDAQRAANEWATSRDEPECSADQQFQPERTDIVVICSDANGCSSRYHHPCAGTHTHGTLVREELRRGICVKVRKRAVRCEGIAVVAPCNGRVVPFCGEPGTETTGIHEE